MNSGQNSQEMEQEKTLSSRQVLSHFWVCSSPFFDTAFLSTFASVEKSESLSSADEPPSANAYSVLRFFDADGFLANEVTIEVSAGRVSVIELDPLLGACKFESGMRHAHLEVSSPEGVRNLCRIFSREGASIVPGLTEISGARRVFFPLMFASGLQSFMPLVNFGEEEVTVRGRLFCGNRSPEIVWVIPPRASRLINLNGEFEEYVDLSGDQRVQAYLRLGLKGEYSVGAQLVERTQGVNGGNLFTSLC